MYVCELNDTHIHTHIMKEESKTIEDQRNHIQTMRKQGLEWEIWHQCGTLVTASILLSLYDVAVTCIVLQSCWITSSCCQPAKCSVTSSLLLFYIWRLVVCQWYEYVKSISVWTQLSLLEKKGLSNTATFWCRIHLWFCYVGGFVRKVDDVTAYLAAQPSRLRAHHRNKLSLRVYCCCCRCILHLQQYSRRLNLFFCCWTFP